MALTVRDFIISVMILFLSFILAKIVIFVLEKVKKLASKTKFTLDDRILEFLERPIWVLFILLGVFFAVYNISPGAIRFGLESRIIHSIIVVIAAYFTARTFAGILRWYGDEIARKTKSHLDDSLIPFMRRAIYLIVFAIAAIVILRLFNVKITAFLAGLGIASLAIGLALQDTLSNFFSGVWMAFDRPVKVGDFIEVDGGRAGYVEEISWRNTRVRTLTNNIIIMPNSKLSQNVVTNYEAPTSELFISVPVYVSYDSDLEKVEKVTLDVGKHIQKTVKGAVKDYEPVVRFSEFREFGVGFSVSLKVASYADQFVIRHEFVKQLNKRFRQDKIEAPHQYVKTRR
ncbi:MAG: mechanosensitive ion channel family protein [archaeon]